MTCGPHDPHCITCSDEAVAMRVVEVHDDGLAVGEDGTTIEIALVEPVARGEVLLVHAVTAIGRQS
jgi:hypothetical protein